MRVQYEQPKLTKTNNSPISDSVETHPAYAQIRASRVSGKACLYGSDFEHQHYVTIEISRSELNRCMSDDHPFPREEYIEIALSEAQWATFVATPNVGMGTQCTLQHKDGVSIPQIETPPQRKVQFENEMKETLRNAADALEALREKVVNSNMTQKGKNELLSTLTQVYNNLAPNVGFVADQFGEHMERVSEQAKMEIAAYLQGAITHAGVATLTDKNPPLQLLNAEEIP